MISLLLPPLELVSAVGVGLMPVLDGVVVADPDKVELLDGPPGGWVTALKSGNWKSCVVLLQQAASAPQQ